MNLPHFRIFTKQELLAVTRLRKFETKLGERITGLKEGLKMEDALAELKSKYIVIGIPESIGVLANHGIAGTETAWSSFLQSFLNIQSNDFLEGSELTILGYFDFADMQSLIDKNAHDFDERVAAYRHAVNAIDDEVESLIKAIVAAGKIPLVVGGGHNNAYPLIKGAAKGLLQLQKISLAQINCINLDAHSDYRPAEGRHSGNAFRYAEDDGFIQKYCVVGLHENYLPQNIWMDIVNNPFIDIITYEDIFIHEKRSFRQAVSHAIDFTEDNYTGIELDLDVIEDMLSSAITPSGISIQLARQYINLCAAHAKISYLHICEGAAQLSNGQSNQTVGKTISFLISDFVKMHSSIKA